MHGSLERYFIIIIIIILKIVRYHYFSYSSIDSSVDTPIRPSSVRPLVHICIPFTPCRYETLPAEIILESFAPVWCDNCLEFFLIWSLPSLLVYLVYRNTTLRVRRSTRCGDGRILLRFQTLMVIVTVSCFFMQVSCNATPRFVWTQLLKVRISFRFQTLRTSWKRGLI